jgi:hypothetical protein
MAGLRFTELQSRPMEFLDFTSRSCYRCALYGFTPAAQIHCD